jgi:predicted acylesterase/phospholipase RssA
MKYLAIGPGSMAFFVYLGIVHKLQESGRFSDLEEIAGASAGSIVGFLFLLANRDVSKVLDYTLQAPIKKAMKPNIKTLLKDYGLVPVSKVHKLLEDACTKFISKPDITFEELYARVPIKLHVSAFCVDLYKTDYFSVERTPKMSVLDAVCMSCAVPFLFSASKFNGWHYIDGGSAESIPCAPFIGRPYEDILALRIAWSRPTEIKNLKSYGLSVMYSILNMRASYTNIPSLEFELDDVDIFDFGSENDVKLKMFMNGQSQNFLL